MKKQLTIICIIGMLLAVGLSGCLENNKDNNGSIILPPTPLSGKVTVTTNKIEYKQNETINITLYNGLNVSILHHRSISEVEKNISTGWKLFFTYNYNPNYDYDLYDPAIELKPNHSVSLDWKDDHLWNWTNDTYEYCLVEPGIYRIKLSYYIENQTSYRTYTVYSNEFSISNSTNDVLITTDNGIYNSNTGINDDHIQGDIINITIINHLGKDIFFDKWFIIPFCSLYFEIYNNGSWEVYDDILGVAMYPASFTFQDWLDGATKLSPNESLTFQYNLVHSSGFNMFQGKYRFRLDYFSMPDEPLVNYSNVDYATYRSEANFASVYSNNFTIMNFPIETEDEAITYAKTDSDANDFIEIWSAEGYKISTWAYFYENEDFWAVGFEADPNNITDTWYEIHFKSDGSIISKGPGTI